MRRLPALLAAAGLVVALSACSGEDAAPEVPPTDRLVAAKAAFDAAGTVQLDLSSRDVPPRENGVTAAKGAGVIHPAEPQFQGTITGTVQGIAATIDVIAIGDTAYLKLFTPEYEETDLDTLGAPNPALFFDPATGISSLLTQTSDATAAGQTRSGQDVLDRIDGNLPGSLIEDLFHLGDGTGTFAVSYGLTDTDELRTATLKGPFFPGVEATYLLTLTDYGVPVEITRP
ncbi:MAG TPA: LppX_LprAFG lipoprotein [Ornithinibacter sp.]|nr:LppX_LprAFG lipoprotein [Ornithinibacter sp.]